VTFVNKLDEGLTL